MNDRVGIGPDCIPAAALLFGKEIDELANTEVVQLKMFFALNDNDRLDEVRKIGLRLGREVENGELCMLEAESRMQFNDNSKERLAFLDGMDQAYDESQAAVTA